MDEIYQADAGDWLYEIWHEDDQWTWRVSDKSSNACLWLDREPTAQLAKNQIVIQTGRGPDDEWRITKIGARATVDDTRLVVRWNADHWEWEVSRIRRHERLGGDITDSLDNGKADALKFTGFAPERVDWHFIA
jgi:hypothetical protein